ncbi:MAG: hypothetical protein E6J82_15590, partial [Deltaproteobacteria bacterium]
AGAGFRAVGPVLPGHGTTPVDLYGVTRGDVIRAAESALLSLCGARRIFLCGLSMGSLLVIHLAARSWADKGLPDFSAIALLAPAIEFARGTWLFANVIGRLPALRVLLGKGARDIRGQPDDREKVAGSYDAIPMRWGAELRALSQEARQLASRVRAPALILQGALAPRPGSSCGCCSGAGTSCRSTWSPPKSAAVSCRSSREPPDGQVRPRDRSGHHRQHRAGARPAPLGESQGQRRVPADLPQAGLGGA